MKIEDIERACKLNKEQKEIVMNFTETIEQALEKYGKNWRYNDLQC